MKKKTDFENLEDELAAVTDPAVMLRKVIENDQFLGYDDYYRPLRDCVMKHVERLAKK